MAILRLHLLTYLAISIVAGICVLTLNSCRPGTETAQQPFLGNFSMGQKVRVGPFTYTVLEARWKASLSNDPQARFPRNRYVIIRLSVTNSGSDEAAFPQLTLQSGTGQEYQEIIEGVSAVPSWLAPLTRNVKPAQTDTGNIVFDVPLGAYKLKVPEPEDVDTPKFALIDIPVQLE
jgi:hypothetical protein